MLEHLSQAIKNGKTDKQVLGQLKTKKANLDPSLLLNQSDFRLPTTLLMEATKRGFILVLKYLHKEWGLSVDEQNQKRRTPLMEACMVDAQNLSAQEAVVDYLAAAQSQVQPDIYGQTLFHYLAITPFEKAISCLYKKFPALINAPDVDGQTPLFRAACHGNNSFVSFCLEQQVATNVADFNGMTPLWAAFYHGQPQVLRQLLESSNCEVILARGLTAMYEAHQQLISAKNISKQTKIACLNAMFSAGAGLELSHLPDDVFSLYNISREKLNDFLIIGEEQIADGTFKKRIISDCEQFKAYLKNPKWRFNVQHLLNACHHPKIADLGHVIKIKAILAEAFPNMAPTCQSQPSSFQLTRTELFRKVKTKQQLLDAFNLSIFLLNRHLGEINKRCLVLHQGTEITRQYGLELSHNLSLYFKIIERFLELAAREGAENIRSESKSVFEDIVINFAQIFQPLLQEFNQNADSEYSGILLPQIENHLRVLLKKHGKCLKSKSRALFNSLSDALVNTCDLMARAHLKQANLDVALNLSVEALRFADAMAIDNESLEENMCHLRARCYATMSQVFIQHGWLNKSARYISKAFEFNSKSGLLFDPMLLELSEKLSATFLERNKPEKSYEILKGAQCALTLIHPFFVDSEILQKRECVKELLAKVESAFFAQRLKIAHEYLKGMATFEVDTQNKKLTINFDFKYAQEDVSILLKAFLEKNPKLKIASNQLTLDVDNLFSSNYLEIIKELSATINNYVEQQQQLVDKLTAEFNELNFSAPKTSSIPIPEYVPDDIETFGFTPLEGFTPIVPMYSSRLPSRTLFMTMPQGDERFKPFYKFIEKGPDGYQPVKAISSDSKNQQGAKLFTVNHENGNKIARARLKVLGAHGKGKLRAQGMVEQTICSQDGKLLKLYVFREVTEKKSEERNNFKINKKV